ncbi:hypothetical protein D3C80_1985360 [compost metagenome]
MSTVRSQQYKETGEEAAGLQSSTFMNIGEKFINLNPDKAETHEQSDAHKDHHGLLVAEAHRMHSQTDCK